MTPRSVGFLAVSVTAVLLAAAADCRGEEPAAAQDNVTVMPGELRLAGQTLGVYGLGQGMYIVLPILGPSSARDAIGLVVDAFLDPLSYLPTTPEALGARALRSETGLSFRFEEYDELTGAAVDPYVAVRDAYLQNREKRVKE